MNVLILEIDSEATSTEGRQTYLDINGDELVVTEYSLEDLGNYSYKTKTKQLEHQFTGVATCNLITSNPDGSEQKKFRNVLVDNIKTLLVSSKELDELFVRLND